MQNLISLEFGNFINVYIQQNSIDIGKLENENIQFYIEIKKHSIIMKQNKKKNTLKIKTYEVSYTKSPRLITNKVYEN